MTMIKYKNCAILYQQQGNGKNGKPLYIVNIFQKGNNINIATGQNLDKYGNIKIQSFYIEEDLKKIVDELRF